jgi:nitrite reductase/ring-hydroxylating ferredoxin subunit
LFGIPSWFVDSMGSWTASVRNSMDEEWIAVCQKTQVSPGAIVPVVAGGINLLIIASKDGKRVYCVANSCPHLGTPLETGMLEQRPTPSVSSLTSLKRKSLSTGGMVSSPTVLNSTDIEGSSESCIVCPLHRTAFALESGEVRGEWCPYPPIIGSIVGLVKPISKLPTFSIRTRGKNIEVLINSLVNEMDESGYSGDKK